MTLEDEVDLEAMFNFLPVVTDMAMVAASLSLFSILPDDVTDIPEEGSESTSREDLSWFY